MSSEAPQLIQVGDHLIPLPPGVTAAEWALERVRHQNPRIRSLLGCIQLLDGVLESNYAILHCSPERLHDIWSRVRQVSRLLRDDIAPLLRSPSCIPALDDARRRAELALAIIEDQVLSQLDRLPARVPAGHLLELRKLLCVSIGQLHVYLQDTFAQLMAADPRSLHDADYFLSRRFPRDVEEAEWLHASVEELQSFLLRLTSSRPLDLSSLARVMREEERLPEEGTWSRIETLLGVLERDLTAKLHELLALRGIRFDEMEVLDRYAVDIPSRCRLLVALDATGREMVTHIEASAGESPVAREQRARHLTDCQLVFSRRVADLLEEIDRWLRDLLAFVPLWLDNIGRRRALMFPREEGEETAGPWATSGGEGAAAP